MAALPDTNANIMLDLETTGNGANPCIIELSAVHFNLNTGAEYSHFSTPISLESCRNAGLQMDRVTLRFVQINMPDILARSEDSQILLASALRDFANWCKHGLTVERENQRNLKRGGGGNDVQMILWGNGAFSDNKWVEAAFHAVKLQNLMPWRYYNHYCVRTFVKQVALITGVDYARRVEMRGRKHVSLDDCRHQVRYLVLARLAVGGKREEMPLPNASLPCEIAEGVKEAVGGEKSDVTAEEEAASASEADTEDHFDAAAREEASSASEADTEDHFDDLEELTAKAERNLDALREMVKEREVEVAHGVEDEATVLLTHTEEADEVEKAPSLPELKKNSGNRRGAAVVRTGLGLGLITPESSFSDPPANGNATSAQDRVDENLVSTQDTERYKNVDENLVSTQDTERYKDLDETISSSQDTVQGGGSEDLVLKQQTEINADFDLVSSKEVERDERERRGEGSRPRDCSSQKRRRIYGQGQRAGLLSPETSFSG